ncbi:hypothetical protein CHEID_00885 [Corynebacterium heidelbergense]|uniref:Uncharacterized protein n=2 Tax=Corynebacterium heidelbergense TaxID=2055947 RepID=A0A364VAS1_9CORY|nr:hypothetical protein [Corynebacterium heidelbergense]RAV33714.1 hypothetical protein CWC39_07085 [Corynebacterium heidelbergense]WCZ35756.1 hypothetical protein CHEID_00885 [Corynebacterium heidelbergense]
MPSLNNHGLLEEVKPLASPDELPKEEDFAGESTIAPGRFYLLKGSLVFVAEVHDPEPDAPLDTTGKPKPRLRVIFENGTESSMFVKSLAIRLYEENGKVLARAGQIDASEIGHADTLAGRLYVLSNLSEDPDITSITDLHKIGFATGSVEKRIQDAEHSPTYLTTLRYASKQSTTCTTCAHPLWRTSPIRSSPPTG